MKLEHIQVLAVYLEANEPDQMVVRFVLIIVVDRHLKIFKFWVEKEQIFEFFKKLFRLYLVDIRLQVHLPLLDIHLLHIHIVDGVRRVFNIAEN